MFISIILLTGCSINSSDNLKSFKDYNSSFDTYNLTGEMTIVSNEDEFKYNIDVNVKDNEYYKVSLTNTITNNEQVILKNDDGVYVVTPSMNKSYKFMSEWPNNSSQSYLLESLVNDVDKDTNTSIKNIKEGYEIKSKVNYPNNPNLDYEIITTDDNFKIKKVVVYNSDNIPMLTVNVSKISTKPKFNNDTFKLESLVTEVKKESSECINECTDTDDACEDTCSIEESTSSILDDIVYPLYVPTDTYLSSKDTIDTDNGSRVILTFAGVDPFILVEETASVYSEMEVVPVNGEPLMLASTIGALSEKSLYWSSNGIDYYLTSNTLDNVEMSTIAESITNKDLLVSKTK